MAVLSISGGLLKLVADYSSGDDSEPVVRKRKLSLGSGDDFEPELVVHPPKKRKRLSLATILRRARKEEKPDLEPEPNDVIVIDSDPDQPSCSQQSIQQSQDELPDIDVKMEGYDKKQLTLSLFLFLCNGIIQM